MIPITKEKCLREIKEESSFKILLLCLVSLICVFTLLGRPYLDKSDPKLFNTMFLIVILAVAVYAVFEWRKVKRISKKCFYIVEDELVRVESDDFKAIKMSLGPKTFYTSLYFRRNGVYKISRTIKEKHSKADRIATTYPAINQKFYLVMYNDKIIKCFDAQKYVIDEDEFVFSDGKYLPK